MEGLSADLYKGLKGYWRRRNYRRLNGATRPRKLTVVQLGRTGEGGSNSSRRRRFWKIKITPKLRLRFSPKKFFIGLRDAYVNFMLRIADTSHAVSGGYGYVYDNPFGKVPVKEYDGKTIAQIYRSGSVTEYDDKMIGQIYRSLVAAQGQLVPRDAARIGKQIDCGK